MPRRLRTPKRRRGAGIDVSESLFHYLVWRDWDGAIARALPGASKWELFDAIGSQHSHKDAWDAIVDEALEAWIARYPGTRPESWWKWSAGELRRVNGRFTVVAGAGRCQPTGSHLDRQTIGQTDRRWNRNRRTSKGSGYGSMASARVSPRRRSTHSPSRGS